MLDVIRCSIEDIRGFHRSAAAALLVLSTSCAAEVDVHSLGGELRPATFTAPHRRDAPVFAAPSVAQRGDQVFGTCAPAVATGAFCYDGSAPTGNAAQ